MPKATTTTNPPQTANTLVSTIFLVPRPYFLLLHSCFLLHAIAGRAAFAAAFPILNYAGQLWGYSSSLFRKAPALPHTLVRLLLLRPQLLRFFFFSFFFSLSVSSSARVPPSSAACLPPSLTSASQRYAAAARVLPPPAIRSRPAGAAAGRLPK